MIDSILHTWYPFYLLYKYQLQFSSPLPPPSAAPSLPSYEADMERNIYTRTTLLLLQPTVYQCDAANQLEERAVQYYVDSAWPNGLQTERGQWRCSG